MFHRKWSIAVLVIALARPAGGDQPKPAGKLNEVEARFTDDSRVRMVVLQESLEIETAYGKLTVPMNEIRRIDFAFRLSDEERSKIESAIRRLADPAFGVRLAATNELSGFGVRAFPALREAAKSKDAETAQRAKDLLQRVRDSAPAAQLRFPDDDLVQTHRFTIAGQILMPTIRARAAYFSDERVQLINLRSMRWLAHSSDHEISIDAAKYGGLKNQWMETEVVVAGQDRLQITASGQVDLWPATPGQYMTGPGGYQGGGQRPGQQVPGTLLGRIGTAGKVFVIGERYEGSPGGDGTLYLQIAPSPWNNESTGEYRVKASVGR